MWFYSVLLMFFFAAKQCSGNAADCLEREKSIGVLDFAKQSIEKVEELFPHCHEDSNSTNSTACGNKEKALAFLQIAKDMISEAQNNYPTCPDVKPDVKPEVKPDIRPTFNPMDCTDVLQLGHNASGVYQVWPRNSLHNKSISVYCDMETDGGGWTVIQRRGGFNVSQNFNRDWNDYKRGFGDLNGEFWLGNDNISSISEQGEYEVRFDLSDFEGNKRFAVYKSFLVEDESMNYKLHAFEYSGNAGDSLSYEVGNPFSTKDRINSSVKPNPPCPEIRGNGWWFNHCNKANINGIPNRKSEKSNTLNLYWKEWKAFESLATADMKLRRIQIQD